MSKNHITAVYSGTFDPMTNGHVDIAARASQLFDKLIIAVSDFPGSKKKHMFSAEERVSFAKEALKKYPNIEITTFNKLLIDFVKDVNSKVIVRGIRSFTDFDYEEQLNGMNSYLDPAIETIYLTCSPHLSFVSSTLVKEVAYLGKDVSDLVPEVAAKSIYNIYKKNHGR
ncbi:MAG: pantetheine-phosphate adenylyltransferase [Gammaproteobacteria bacterium]|nr:MAG: pantetheine-phosphate adenylyltransferase [Gammaproteobacteria bacterium]